MLSRRFVSAGLVMMAAALAVPLGACSGATTEQPAANASGLTTGPLAVTIHGRGRAVVDALAQVPLRTEQRTTIEQLAKDTESKAEPMRKAREQLILAVADQVQAGAIDKAALQPKIDAVTAEMGKVRPIERGAFERLHALLTPEQRVALASALQAKLDAHGGGHGGGVGAPHDGPRGEHMMRMQKWATDLSLTPEQQDQIRQKLTDKWTAHAVEDVTAAGSGADPAVVAGGRLRGMMRFRMHREQTSKMLEAFKGDKFSMDESMPMQDLHADAHEMSGRMIEMVEMVLPILTAEQRGIAATKLRERAARFEDNE